ncbi:MAG: alpha-glucan family phosphorylase [Saprospiraceae bacterium]|nr:alpha-glucan family phosphorylase [Saprospiraceae bacterium]
MIAKSDIFGYKPNKAYEKSVAYFSMEFAIDQSLKTYSGGLGFLAGSHMRSAYQLKQNLLGIGILWKYGYYDQVRASDGSMKSDYIQKHYSFLHDTGIVFPVIVKEREVFVKAYLLKPETFQTTPIFFLSTDLPENDEDAKKITDHLYDSHEEIRVAQSIVLGIGGAKLIDILGINIDLYHINEGHALPVTFYLYDKFKSIEEVRKHFVFTTHTPEAAGNEEHNFELVSRMSLFCGIPDEEVKSILDITNNRLNYTLGALKFAKIANAVSEMHGDVSREMWEGNENICDIISITNAQDEKYWTDNELHQAFKNNDNNALASRKIELKKSLFNVVADQSGKLFDENVFTLVWARRFAGYKRADLITYDFERFARLLANKKYPIQIIWAGKPYPKDYGAIDTFNKIFKETLQFPNCTILTGYELALSATLKKGSDAWLNNPKLYREASGTSGMTAAMNGSVNFSIPDGWIPEFSKHGQNCFLAEPADRSLSEEEQNVIESSRLLDILENEILPTYYEKPDQWWQIVKNAMEDVVPRFDSKRMAKEYYDKLFNK